MSPSGSVAFSVMLRPASFVMAKFEPLAVGVPFTVETVAVFETTGDPGSVPSFGVTVTVTC